MNETTPLRRLRLGVVNEPGVMASVASVFAAQAVNIETLTLTQDSQELKRAVIDLLCSGDERACDLIRRKLSRLIPVLWVELQGTIDDGSVQCCASRHSGVFCASSRHFAHAPVGSRVLGRLHP